jgi:hypothetical protein
MGIVIQPAAGDEDLQVSGKTLDLGAGDELGEVEGMAADVADAARRA